MLMRDNELARRQDGRVELRSRPLRVHWSFDDLASSDGHELRAVFTCSVRALTEPAERRMLEEVLLGSRYSVSDDEVSSHFAAALRSAAANLGRRHAAADWVGGSITSEMADALRAAAAPIAFGCGVELLPPFNLDLQSPTFQQQQLRAMQQALTEKQTAGQLEHVQRAAELLKQFQQIRSSTPELPPGRVLEQISPADRGDVLHSLLLASAKQDAVPLWAVAGPYLIRFDPQDAAARPQLFPLPPELGPLRSVQGATVDGQTRLLVGARSGFMVIDPERPAEPHLYYDPGVDSPLGFNRVIYLGPGRGFAASHGAAGIVVWAEGNSQGPSLTLRPNQLGAAEAPIASASGSTTSVGPRNLRALADSTLVFSSGAALITTDLRDIHPLHCESNAEIVALLPQDRQVTVIHSDGTICGLDPVSRKVSRITRRGNQVRSAGTLPWLGATRLLLACEQGPVDCVGLDDPLITQYHSPHSGLKEVCGSSNAVAGISADRQRLVLWRSWDGRQALAESYLTGLTRHRVADIDFV